MIQEPASSLDVGSFRIYIHSKNDDYPVVSKLVVDEKNHIDLFVNVRNLIMDEKKDSYPAISKIICEDTKNIGAYTNLCNLNIVPEKKIVIRLSRK